MIRNIVAFVSWAIAVTLLGYLVLGWGEHIDVLKVAGAVAGIGLFGVVIPIIVKTGGRR